MFDKSCVILYTYSGNVTYSAFCHRCSFQLPLIYIWLFSTLSFLNELFLRDSKDSFTLIHRWDKNSHNKIVWCRRCLHFSNCHFFKFSMVMLYFICSSVCMGCISLMLVLVLDLICRPFILKKVQWNIFHLYPSTWCSWVTSLLCFLLCHKSYVFLHIEFDCFQDSSTHLATRDFYLMGLILDVWMFFFAQYLIFIYISAAQPKANIISWKNAL